MSQLLDCVVWTVLFDRNAVWNDIPNGLLSWGYTVMRTRPQLESDFEFATRK